MKEKKRKYWKQGAVFGRFKNYLMRQYFFLWENKRWSNINLIELLIIDLSKSDYIA